jgi:mannose/fructose/N-acetylgalactosamine-specific phosphotransferase system component IID
MKKITAAVVGAFTLLAVVATSAHAAASYSLTPVTTNIEDTVQAALTTILPIAGGILALFVAWKVLKRMVKA